MPKADEYIYNYPATARMPGMGAAAYPPQPRPLGPAREGRRPPRPNPKRR